MATPDSLTLIAEPHVIVFGRLLPFRHLVHRDKAYHTTPDVCLNDELAHSATDRSANGAPDIGLGEGG